MADNEINIIDDRFEERNLMVEFQLLRRGITNEAVLASMLAVPRHIFVPYNRQVDAYLDSPLLIGEGQTISQPFIVALMAQALEPSKLETVLEIGTGSGYSAAVLAQVFATVYTVERHKSLAKDAQEKFEKLGYDNIKVLIGDGTKGWPDQAPYDAIISTAGGPKVPPGLYQQLRVGGRLVIPVGEELTQQRLLRFRLQPDGKFTEEDLGEVRFVPLIGEEGWKED